MYYRRKVLLALIEAFGGRLERTDCQKLLFLFCQYSKQNYYDFFPYKFGGFSLLAYHDKKRLTDLGHLNEGDEFKLRNPEQSFFDQLKLKDRNALSHISSEFENLRGRDLIRRVYLNYPQFTCRSKIVSNVLSSKEIEQVSLWWNTDESPCLFTIGYEGLSIDAYLNKLISNNVMVLIDVRKNPHSMKYGFSKSILQKYVKRAGLEYIHIPELGIPSKLRQNLNTPEAYRQLFQFYETEILPNSIDAVEKIKTLYAKFKRIALTCFEADYNFCHRHKITGYLENSPNFDTKIVHLK